MNARRRMAIMVAIAAVVVVALVAGFLARRERGDAGDAGDAGDRKADQPTSRVVRMGDEAAIVLDLLADKRANIGTAPLRSAGDGTGGGADGAGLPGIQLSGELVSDPSRVSSIRAPVPGKLSSDSWPTLDAHIAAGQLLGRVSDAKPLTAPRNGTVVQVDAQPGEIVQAGQELLVLADFASPLVRIVWRPELGSTPPQSLTVAPLDAAVATSPEIRARLVGAAAMVDSLTRMPVYLYRLAGAWRGARPGTPVIATARDVRDARGAGGARGGRDSSQSAAGSVLVPDAAVVQWEGLAWAFVQRGPRSYVRARVMTDYPVAGGFVVSTASSGLQPGNLVVVRGAQQLLSEEFRTHVQLGDEEDAKK